MTTTHALFLLLLLPLACSSGGADRDTDSEAALDVSPGLDLVREADDAGEEDAPTAPCAADDDCTTLAGQNPCRTAHCLKGAGVCVVEDLAESAPCDLDDPCFLETSCRHGVCQGLARGCDDGDPCTADSCASDQGGCVHPPAPGEPACDDDAACTTDDRCVAGGCIGTQVFCAEDGNPCTSAACDPDSGECQVGVLLAAPCDDGDPCTTDDACDEGADCTGVPVTCSDGNPCTSDACAPASGACAFTPLEGQGCDDGNPCTVADTCHAGACVGEGFGCDDGNPCTTDVCSLLAAGGCQHLQLNGTACDDGDPCTLDDHCLAAQCVPGAVVGGCCHDDASCDDGDPCTLDECVNQACTSTPITCAIDDPCGWARCVDGACQADLLPPGGSYELLHAGFESGEGATGLTVVGGNSQPGTVFAGTRSLAVMAQGEALRAKDLFLPAGTSAVQGWMRAPDCWGTGLLVAIDGVPYELGCGDVSRWSPFQVPIVADADGLHTVEVLWWGGAPLWLDEISVVLVGRAGCGRGPVTETLGAPADVLAASVVVGADRRPAVAIARVDDGTGATIQLARPEATGWSFAPVVAGGSLSSAASLVFDAAPRAGGGVAVVWYAGTGFSKLATWAGDGTDAAVVTLLGTGPKRWWPGITALADGRLFVGLTADKVANGRFQPIGLVYDGNSIQSGSSWKPSIPDAAAANRVAVVELDTRQRALVWTRDGELRAAIANLDGKQAVADFAAHTGTISGAGRIAAAALTDGRFVVIWEQAGLGTDLAGSLIDSYGTVLVDAFPVAVDATGDERNPDVVGTTDGRFVVAWEDQPQGGAARVVARVFQGYGDGGVETVLDPGPNARSPRLAPRPPYQVEAVWLSGSEVRLRPWGFDCAGDALRCQGGVPQICVGTTYARLGGSCSGPGCEPGPCP